MCRRLKLQLNNSAVGRLYFKGVRTSLKLNQTE